MPTPTLVLVPGLVCDGAVWEHAVGAFSGQMPVHIADHGTLDSLPAMAQRILDEVSGPVAVAGHSMGGRVALELARIASRRLRGIALMDTGFQPLPQGEAGRREADGRWRLEAVARREGMRVMAREWVQQMVHPARLDEPALINAILDMFARKSADIFAAQTRALLARPDASDVIDALRCPTLVLCGREDNWAPVERHREMAERIAGSTLAVIAVCGHMCTMERPEDVTHALRKWLEKIDG